LITGAKAIARCLTFRRSESRRRKVRSVSTTTGWEPGCGFTRRARHDLHCRQKTPPRYEGRGHCPSKRVREGLKYCVLSYFVRTPSGKSTGLASAINFSNRGFPRRESQVGLRHKLPYVGEPGCFRTASRIEIASSCSPANAKISASAVLYSAGL